MEGAILAIHFVPRFIVLAVADRWPFRLVKAITHDTPFANPPSCPNGCVIEHPPISSAFAIMTPPQERGDPLRKLCEGFGVRKQLRFWISRAYTGSLRGGRRTHRSAFVPSVC